MSAIKALLDLYEKIPTFECEKGCTDCCGVIIFSELEWNRLPKAWQREATSINCPYSAQGKCDIYDMRPFICRLYGTADDPLLTCPKGCGPEKKLSQSEARALTLEYKQDFF